MSAKHTPGPWEVAPLAAGSDGFSGFKIEGAGLIVAEVEAAQDYDSCSMDVTRADARLIAAAPEMLEELRRCFDFASAVYEADRAAGKERSAEQARKRANCISQLIAKVEG